MGNRNKRGQKASETQKLYLIEFLEQRPDLANVKFATADGPHSRDWNTLSVKLNSLGGTVKDGPKWRKYWKDLTIGVRSRKSAIKKKWRKSGPGSAKDLSETDKRIIAITTPKAEVSAIIPNAEGGDSVIGSFEAFVIKSEKDEIYDEPKESAASSIYTETMFPMTLGEGAIGTGYIPMTENRAASDPPTTKRSQRKRPKARTLSNVSEESLDDFREEFRILEEKKIKLKEKKIRLIEESNRIQNEIKNKLDKLIQAIINK